MAPVKKRDGATTFKDRFLRKLQKLDFTYDMVMKIIFDPCYIQFLGFILLLFEVCLNIFIIETVKYTEIDWKAYMQEIEGVINGTWDYTKLQGDTGPLVYPAGFVYVFMALYYATSHGKNIKLAQYIFTAFYLITLWLVIRIFHKSKKVPPYVLLFLCCASYRIHSIYVLRLFNDPVAMMFLYAAINCFIINSWTLGSIFFSLAVSVKMNILLFAPALLLIYLHSLGVVKSIIQISVCATIQVALGLPFLITNPVGYLMRSFDVGRVFLYEWTVNWKLIPEEVFVSRLFHVGLLLMHIGLVCLFAYTHWDRFLRNYIPLRTSGIDVACQLLILPLFMSNFVGIVASRSLHYQFYVWYFHSLPYILWSTQFSVKFRLLLLGLIEISWNTFPSTAWSSALLHICHITIVVGLYHNRPTEQVTSTIQQRIDSKVE